MSSVLRNTNEFLRVFYVTTNPFIRIWKITDTDGTRKRDRVRYIHERKDYYELENSRVEIVDTNRS